MVSLTGGNTVGGETENIQAGRQAARMAAPNCRPCGCSKVVDGRPLAGLISQSWRHFGDGVFRMIGFPAGGWSDN